MISFNSYFFLSLIITIASIINAYTLHEQFYSTMIYLSTSKIHRLILLNMSFSFYCGVLRGLLTFFFQDVRENEKLSILEKVKRKVFDFALMLIVFREDSLDLTFFSLLFLEFYLISSLVFFLGLISFSVLHWLTIKRSEYVITNVFLLIK